MRILKTKFFFAIAAIGLNLCCCAKTTIPVSDDNIVEAADTSIVYFIKDISPESLQQIYNALDRKAVGNKIGVKISTGESELSNQLDPHLIGPFVKSINGTFIECNTAYDGNRNTYEKHREAVKKRGYLDYADVDIMDAFGDTILPVNGGKHLKYDLVGKNFPDYDFMVVLSHFKGHQMGGFGGALKNISIGIGSSRGKAYIHSGGVTDDPSIIWKNIAEQDIFLESMADACKAIIDHIGDNVIYINVANKLSVDCDCNGHPAAPQMGDIGILASTDPVALDQACVDMVFNSNDPGKVHLIERINSRHGTHTIDAAEELGLGSKVYIIKELNPVK